jgi:hypothetical protein
MKYFHYKPVGNGEWFTDPAPFSELALALDDLFVVLDDVSQTMTMSSEERGDFLAVRADLARIEERVCSLDLTFRHKRNRPENVEPIASV